MFLLGMSGSFFLLLCLATITGLRATAPTETPPLVPAPDPEAPPCWMDEGEMSLRRKAAE